MSQLQEVYFPGEDISSLPASQLKGVRRNIQMIFQDPFTSLDPRMHIGSIVEEGMKVHRVASLLRFDAGHWICWKKWVWERNIFPLSP